MNIRSISSKIKGKPTPTAGTAYSVLVICSLSHFLNDMIQSIIPSIYPIIKDKFDYSFAQIGVITLMFQMTSSILQPFTGLYADRHSRPYALSAGMCCTLAGLLLLAFVGQYVLNVIITNLIVSSNGKGNKNSLYSILRFSLRHSSAGCLRGQALYVRLGADEVCGN